MKTKKAARKLAELGVSPIPEEGEAEEEDIEGVGDPWARLGVGMEPRQHGGARRREEGGRRSSYARGKLVVSLTMAPGSSGAGREWGFVERRRRRGKRGKERNPRMRPGAAF